MYVDVSPLVPTVANKSMGTKPLVMEADHLAFNYIRYFFGYASPHTTQYSAAFNPIGSRGGTRHPDANMENTVV